MMDFVKPINWGMKKFFPENMAVVDNGHAITMTEKLSVKMAEHFDDAIASAILNEMGAQGGHGRYRAEQEGNLRCHGKAGAQEGAVDGRPSPLPPVQDSYYPPHRLRQCPLLRPLRAVCVMEVGVMETGFNTQTGACCGKPHAREA